MFNILFRFAASALWRSVLLCLFFVLFFISSCSKLVDIGPPINTITTEQVFEDSANAVAGISGLYLSLRNSGVISFSSGLESWMGSILADEMRNFDASGTLSPFYTNTLLSNNSEVSQYWKQGYSLIYHANACIEALERSKSISIQVRDQLLGEVRFIRAWCYFYLVNFYGDVPFVTSTDWKVESIKPRVPKAQIYDRIIEDLDFSMSHLQEEYNTPSNEHTRVNKWVVAAFLARIYLYLENWELATKFSSMVINKNSLYRLEPNLDDVFLRNSREQIFHLSLDTKVFPANATNFYAFLPAFFPRVFLTPPLLNDFESGDQRRVKWVKSINRSGVDYYYPYKYKIGTDRAVIGSPATEYFTLIRLAEMYLIRSEARVHQGDLVGAIEDLNFVRNRAGLAEFTSLVDAEILKAIVHERRIEYFAEWGHRWLDLKRTDNADAVLSKLKPTWTASAKLLPIPLSELRTNQLLTQNPGY